MSEGPDQPRRTGLAARAGGALPVLAIAATYAGLLAWSWGTWPDVLVDFGHELYAPWQLSQGRALGVDIAWGATGPLPPYANALLFAVFGASLRTIVLANLVVLASITALVFLLARTLSDRLSATLAAVAFLAVFAFGQYVGIGNYNYVAPYSHGVTHGMLLALASLWLLQRHEASGGTWRLVASGGAIGLLFLAKLELFVACLGAAGVLWTARRAGERRGARAAARDLLCLAGPAVAVPVVAWGLLSTRMPAGEAWRVTVTPWLLAQTSLATNAFYLSGMGLDRPVENLAALARAGAWWAAVIGGLALLDRGASWLHVPRPLAAAVSLLGTLVVSTALLPLDALYELARPFPLLVAAGAVTCAWRVLARGATPEARSRAALGLALTVFAGVLLGKMLLNARIHHYGFVLAMPAAILVVVWMTFTIPRWLARGELGGWVFRAAAAGLVLSTSAGFVRISQVSFAQKPVPVGAGADRFRADERGAYVAEMMRQLERFASPGENLAVIPEGVMMNFLTRRRNPTPYLTYLPDAIAAFGEERMLAAYRRDPPDLVLLVQRDSSEHGATFFGRDYAQATQWWLQENYRPVALVGAVPFSSEAYGMLLLRRVDGDAVTGAGAPGARGAR